MSKQTEFYAVVYNDGEVAGPVLASLWLKKPKADAEALKLERSLLREAGCKGGAGVIVIDTSKAK